MGLGIGKRLSREVKKSAWRPPSLDHPLSRLLFLEGPCSGSICFINSSFTMALLLHYRKRTRDRSKVKMWVHSFQNSEEFQASVVSQLWGLLGWECREVCASLLTACQGPFSGGVVQNVEHQYPGTETTNHKNIYNQRAPMCCSWINWRDATLLSSDS